MAREGNPQDIVDLDTVLTNPKSAPTINASYVNGFINRPEQEHPVKLYQVSGDEVVSAAKRHADIYGLDFNETVVAFGQAWRRSLAGLRGAVTTHGESADRYKVTAEYHLPKESRQKLGQTMLSKAGEYMFAEDDFTDRFKPALARANREEERVTAIKETYKSPVERMQLEVEVVIKAREEKKAQEIDLYVQAYGISAERATAMIDVRNRVGEISSRIAKNPKLHENLKNHLVGRWQEALAWYNRMMLQPDIVSDVDVNEYSQVMFEQVQSVMDFNERADEIAANAKKIHDKKVKNRSDDIVIVHSKAGGLIYYEDNPYGHGPHNLATLGFRGDRVDPARRKSRDMDGEGPNGKNGGNRLWPGAKGEERVLETARKSIYGTQAITEIGFLDRVLDSVDSATNYAMNKALIPIEAGLGIVGFVADKIDKNTKVMIQGVKQLAQIEIGLAKNKFKETSTALWNEIHKYEPVKTDSLNITEASSNFGDVLKRYVSNEWRAFDSDLGKLTGWFVNPVLDGLAPVGFKLKELMDRGMVKNPFEASYRKDLRAYNETMRAHFDNPKASIGERAADSFVQLVDAMGGYVVDPILKGIKISEKVMRGIGMGIEGTARGVVSLAYILGRNTKNLVTGLKGIQTDPLVRGVIASEKIQPKRKNFDLRKAAATLWTLIGSLGR